MAAAPAPPSGSQHLTHFGQVVLGPPGSGKTTYCHGMSQFLSLIGRKVAVINLDPANDTLPYECAVDVSELVTASKVMDELELGPNGAFIYCMEYLEKNLDWLDSKLAALSGHYFIFDCPGQVELYTHYSSLKNILEHLQKNDYRLTAVHLVDSICCSEPSNFLSALLLSLNCMAQLELPHVNVLSKVDLIGNYDLPFTLEYYADGQNLRFLSDHMKHSAASGRFTKKYAKLTKSLCELVEDYGLVGFTTLDIQDRESVWDLLQIIDKSVAYHSPAEHSAVGVTSVLCGSGKFAYERVAEIQEKYSNKD